MQAYTQGRQAAKGYTMLVRSAATHAIENDEKTRISIEHYLRNTHGLKAEALAYTVERVCEVITERLGRG